MHPIERLRYVARASGVEQGLLVRETAGALASLGFDPPGLVTACRRIIDRHPASGPLWWLSARVLTAGDPVAEAWRAADEIADDPTPDELAHSIPDEATICVIGWPEQIGDALPRRGDLDVLVVDALGEGSGLVRRLQRAEIDAIDVPMAGLGAAVADSDLVLLEASAFGPGGWVGVAGSRAAAAVARHADIPIWVVSGIGRMLPARMWQALCGRLADDLPWEADEDIVPSDLCDIVVGSSGPLPLADAFRRIDCPIAPELYKAST